MIQLKTSSSASAQVSFPDMTALLDVIFILLVFLLLTANVVPKVLDVDLPGKGVEETHNLEMAEPVTITLFADANQWGLNDDQYRDWNQFETALLAAINQGESPQIVIAGDKRASLENVLRIFAWLQGHDLQAAQVMMQSE